MKHRPPQCCRGCGRDTRAVSGLCSRCVIPRSDELLDGADGLADDSVFGLARDEEIADEVRQLLRELTGDE